MRDYLLIFINGQEEKIQGTEAFLTLADFLRNRRGLTGTKVVCAEGDCGACSVLVGRVVNSMFHYEVVDSCILFMFQLDGSHVVTVEGLGNYRQPSIVQKQMVEHHGTQCGYCTPGFVVALSALFENYNGAIHGPLSRESVQKAVTGNLCRCTGYDGILQAALSINPQDYQKMNQCYNVQAMLKKIGSLDSSLALESEEKKVFCPTSVQNVLALKQQFPGARLLMGGTDLGVQFNKGKLSANVFIYLGGVEELKKLDETESELKVGAGVTLLNLESMVQKLYPDFYRILNVFASPQIKAVGTLGGNVANASPIGDSIPFLMVMGAQVEVRGLQGLRRIELEKFYRGYKQLDLNADEIITAIYIPKIKAGEVIKLYKISKRKDLDISSFTAAFKMELTPQQIMQNVRVAYGGVGPVVQRLNKVESELQGQKFSKALFTSAGKIARSEVKPIDDVRGSVEYRCLLAENIMTKFYFEVARDLGLEAGVYGNL